MFRNLSLKTLNVVPVHVGVVFSVLHLKRSSLYRHELSLEDLNRVWLSIWFWQSKRFCLLNRILIVYFPCSEVHFEIEVGGGVIVWSSCMLNEMIDF